MQFHRWRLIGKFRNDWENHVFPVSGLGVNEFTSLCEQRFGALNGEGKRHKYCVQCHDLAPIAEEKFQEKERARVEKLELKRTFITERIVKHLSEMPIDDLIILLRSMKIK